MIKIKISRYIDDPRIYAIFCMKTQMYIVSTNPDARNGIIVII